jgi:hypothetical protein
MPQGSTEALRAFNEALEGCAKAIDGKQIELDLACVYRLVQNNKEAAISRQNSSVFWHSISRII